MLYSKNKCFLQKTNFSFLFNSSVRKVFFLVEEGTFLHLQEDTSCRRRRSSSCSTMNRPVSCTIRPIRHINVCDFPGKVHHSALMDCSHCSKPVQFGQLFPVQVPVNCTQRSLKTRLPFRMNSEQGVLAFWSVGQHNT